MSRPCEQEAAMVTIRPERPEDAAGIRAVHGAAFPTDTEARLVDRLRAGGQARVSLVAEEDRAIVGHVLFLIVPEFGEGCFRPWSRPTKRTPGGCAASCHGSDGG